MFSSESYREIGTKATKMDVLEALKTVFSGCEDKIGPWVQR